MNIASLKNFNINPSIKQKQITASKQDLSFNGLRKTNFYLS